MPFLSLTMRQQIFSSLVVAGVIVGGILVNVPLAVGWFYGNLSAYIDSYYIAVLGQEEHTAGSLWLTSIWLLGASVFITVSGVMSRRIGPRLTLVTGMICFNVGIYTSYFSLQSSFWSLHVTLGLLAGGGTGLAYSMTLLYARTWVKQRVGLASAAVTCTLGGGALFVNLAITFYINPQNLPPDISFGESKYFSQSEIIDRVPYVFLVIGALSTGCHLVAILLMRNHPDFDKYKNSDKEALQNDTSYMKMTDEYVYNMDSYAPIGTPNSPAIDNSENRTSSYHVADLLNGSNVLTELVIQLTPGQILKTSSFYLISATLALLMVGFTIENSMYKQFGLVYISDDYFLTNIGVGINIAVAVSRIMWGFLLDVANVKTVYIAVTVSHTILSAFWYFTPLVNQWFYLFWTLALQSADSGIVIVSPVAVLRLYGSEHYLTNYGLAFFVSTIVGLAVPQVASVVLADLGWFWVFFLVPSTSLCALVIAVCMPWFP